MPVLAGRLVDVPFRADHYGSIRLTTASWIDWRRGISFRRKILRTENQSQYKDFFRRWYANSGYANCEIIENNFNYGKSSNGQVECNWNKTSWDFFAQSQKWSFEILKKNCSKCSSGHVESSFENTSQKFQCIFFSDGLPILWYFSQSSNFSLQFIDVPPDFFDAVVFRNRVFRLFINLNEKNQFSMQGALFSVFQWHFLHKLFSIWAFSSITSSGARVLNIFQKSEDAEKNYRTSLYNNYDKNIQKPNPRSNSWSGFESLDNPFFHKKSYSCIQSSYFWKARKTMLIHQNSRFWRLTSYFFQKLFFSLPDKNNSLFWKNFLEILSVHQKADETPKSILKNYKYRKLNFFLVFGFSFFRHCGSSGTKKNKTTSKMFLLVHLVLWHPRDKKSTGFDFAGCWNSFFSKTRVLNTFFRV